MRIARFSLTPAGLAPLGVVAATTALAAFIGPGLGPGLDDAQIFFRYARHLAGGHGFVWNVGGERVEGASSAVWLAWLTLGETLGIPCEWWAPLSSLVVVALLGRVLFAWTSEAGEAAGVGARAGLVFGCLWFAASATHVGWVALTQMETGLHALLVTTACLQVARGGPSGRLAIVLALLVANRPDGVAIAGLLGAYVLVRPPEELSLRSRLGPLAVVVASSLTLALVRWTVFGDPQPNTYYAKHLTNLGDRLLSGLGYAGRFGASYPHVVAAALVLLVVLLRRDVRDSSERRHVEVTLLGLAASLALPLVAGADHFEGFRFFQPFWAAFGVSVLLALARVHRSAPEWRRPLAVSAVLLLAVVGARDWRALQDDWLGYQIALRGRATGLALSGLTLDGRRPTLGAIAVGGLGAVYDGPVFDLMGLNDREMAHSKAPRDGLFADHRAFDADVFFSRPPDLLVDAGAPCTEPPRLEGGFARDVLKRVDDDPRFAATYEARRVDWMTGGDRCALVRRDVADRLTGPGAPRPR